ncbi:MULTISPECIES: double-cubane-cluster-containing anaerobic reductase [Psychrilyobacter]|uniref:2-hydroxyacyl-CoA dehydratase n=1 Tax=Psychrilyobacter piezotolerans TaxID=2293438 RepID=A0ABX9KF85_9FUSO|nr:MULTISPECIES: double-cubane-cluster-containing anaerobic reductase [Psychrilyobacter]MCS5422512.1 double-cubane-cluster-containing anaerobic reductase [Psychrilyobacter sp. S5]NDI78624.1 2-hydroxyacyl-CoA dehydratase [Psychrilyobacter piezotolerans]RDE60326.1 2-hydroxyacyl-CoA dehydratase [Psychrilyobacter sp. S5]REI40434.1 2-hydroxyacyl-CoA dehydratase [Psychrilyobacter piezotolerans]
MKSINKLPENFQDFEEARRDGFLTIKELKDSGKNIVGTFCTYTPKELIYAAGAVPVSLCSVSEETIPTAEKHLPKNLCPLIKASYGYALTDKCPYMYFADMIVGETTCDGKKKMYELLGELKDTYIMQLPQTQDKERGMDLWKEEVSRFKDKLEKKFNVSISKEKISEAISQINDERKLLKEFYSLGKLTPPPLSGYEMHKVLNGVSYTFDKKLQNEKIREIIENLKEIDRNKSSKVSVRAPRILITGCPIGGVAEKIIKPIEDAGAVVVSYENCGGAKNLDRLVDETIDPIQALAEKYISIPCSVMSPNTDREDLLKRLMDEYQIDGVVEVILQACHTYSVETHMIKRVVTKEKDVPYIALETDYSTGDTGQIKTRIEAFIEML